MVVIKLERKMIYYNKKTSYYNNNNFSALNN